MFQSSKETSMLLLVFMLATQASAAEIPASDPPRWLVRAHGDGHPQLPDAYAHNVIRSAHLGNAMIPTGIAVTFAGGVMAAGFRGSKAGIWGATITAGMGMSVGGAIGTGIALERARIDLAYRGRHVDTSALWAGHVMSGIGILGLGAAFAMLGTDTYDDQGLAIALGASGVLAAASIPYAIQINRTRWAYDEAPSPSFNLSMAPSIDVHRQMVGLSVSGRF
jgi:hypothetical protein